MSDENKIIIERYPDLGYAGPIEVTIPKLGSVPGAVFDAAQHYGGGTYTAKLPSGERVFKLHHEWIDDDSNERGVIAATEYAAWTSVVSELRRSGVGDINVGGKNERLHDAIVAWAEELVQLRLNDPDPSHAETALAERRAKYLGGV